MECPLQLMAAATLLQLMATEDSINAVQTGSETHQTVRLWFGL